jgi:hypothetical protein
MIVCFCINISIFAKFLGEIKKINIDPWPVRDTMIRMECILNYESSFGIWPSFR